MMNEGKHHCRICLEEIEASQPSVATLGCGCHHGCELIHTECSRKWFLGKEGEHDRCEICLQRVRDRVLNAAARKTTIFRSFGYGRQDHRWFHYLLGCFVPAILHPFFLASFFVVREVSTRSCVGISVSTSSIFIFHFTMNPTGVLTQLFLASLMSLSPIVTYTLLFEDSKITSITDLAHPPGGRSMEADRRAWVSTVIGSLAAVTIFCIHLAIRFACMWIHAIKQDEKEGEAGGRGDDGNDGNDDEMLCRHRRHQPRITEVRGSSSRWWRANYRQMIFV